MRADRPRRAGILLALPSHVLRLLVQPAHGPCAPRVGVLLPSGRADPRNGVPAAGPVQPACGGGPRPRRPPRAPPRPPPALPPGSSPPTLRPPPPAGGAPPAGPLCRHPPPPPS